MYAVRLKSCHKNISECSHQIMVPYHSSDDQGEWIVICIVLEYHDDACVKTAGWAVGNMLKNSLEIFLITSR